MSILYSRVELYKKLDDVSWNPDYEVIEDATQTSITEGIGKIKDSFRFRILNANNNLYKTYYNGNGSAVTFNLIHYPIPTQVQESAFRNFGVFLKSNGTWERQDPSDFTINNVAGTITFNSAPPAGQKNIRIDFTVIEPDDTIRIYHWKNTSWGELGDKLAYLKIEGTVKDPAETIEEMGGLLQVRGYSLIETLFSTNIILDCNLYTAAEMVGGSAVDPTKSGILDQQQLQNEYRKVYWHPDNPTIRSDGTDFPKESYAQAYKNAMECLDEVSSEKYTHDGHYITYLKIGNNNANPSETTGKIYLVWKPKPKETEYIIEDSVAIKVDIGKPVDDVVNAIMYNAGKDCYGHSIHYLRYNATSFGAVGAKWKYVQLLHIAPGIVQAEYERDKTKWSTKEGAREENFPLDENYPWTFKFDARDANGNYTGVAASAANDGEFNNIVRIEAKWLGYKESGTLLEMWSNPRYRATVDLARVSSYIRGELMTLKEARYNFNDVTELTQLRINQITHTFWETQLQMEEDSEIGS